MCRRILELTPLGVFAPYLCAVSGDDNPVPILPGCDMPGTPVRAALSLARLAHAFQYLYVAVLDRRWRPKYVDVVLAIVLYLPNLGDIARLLCSSDGQVLRTAEARKHIRLSRVLRALDASGDTQRVRSSISSDLLNWALSRESVAVE